MTADTPKILIVDDRPENLLALESILEGLNLNILKAATGNDALKTAAREDLALILLDAMMPEMDGFETAELLRHNNATRHIPIIFLTAIGTEEDHVFRGYESGAVDYIFKPIKRDILLSKIKVFLELDRRRRELQRSEETTRALLNAALDSAILIDTEGIVLAANEIAARRLNKEVSELVGASIFSVLPPELAASRRERMKEAERTARPVRFEDQRGEMIFDNQVYPILDRNKKVTRLAIYASDITERRNAEALLVRMARYDQLTGLPNRTVFSHFLAKAIARSRRYQRSLAVCFLDLDYFKEINDTLGHDAGDELLKSVAERISGCIRSSDLVARLGGDEFILILDDIKHAEDAACVAQKILDALAAPHRVGGRDIVISSSIGIAVYSGGSETPEELNRAADTAMYHAKKAGRNNYQFFVPEMHKRALEHARFEKELRRAIERGEFRLVYQPLVDARTNLITGFETLLRWQHHRLGVITPARFVPLAENSGLIGPIGEWVLGAACVDCLSWQANRPDAPPLSLAVNVSLRQLMQERFWETVEKTVRRVGFAPHRLEIELTEGTIMDDPEKAIKVLERIRGLGVRIAIDDFGTGCCSLSFLRRLPIDAIKIDLSFVRAIGEAGDNESIVRAIIGIGRNLGFRVIAEGVETADQAAFLRLHRCHFMQGFYFGKPIDHPAVGRLLAKGRTVDL